MQISPYFENTASFIVPWEVEYVDARETGCESAKEVGAIAKLILAS